MTELDQEPDTLFQRVARTAAIERACRQGDLIAAAVFAGTGRPWGSGEPVIQDPPWSFAAPASAEPADALLVEIVPDKIEVILSGLTPDETAYARTRGIIRQDLADLD